MPEAAIAIAIASAAVLVILLLLLRKRSGSGGEMEFSYDLSEGERFSHKWGYTDTRFEFDSPRTVRVTGNRYPLSGYSMPGFMISNNAFFFF